MRSVPHRVVCLVGLDDGVFPRLESVDGDDVLARRPLTGERDIRSEDRQLLLDAIGAATETLVITYAGRGEHTNDDKPPAVPLGELLDTLDRTTSAPVRDDVVRPAPAPALRRGQPDVRRAGPRDDRPFSFDRTALAGARAARAPGSRASGARARPAGRAGGGRGGLAQPTSRTSSPTRCAASCATGCGSRRPTTSTRPRTPSRSPSTAWRSGTSATGSSATCSPAATRRRRCWPSSSAACCPRGPRGGDARPTSSRSVRPLVEAADAAARRARPHPRRRHRPRRPSPHRHRRRRLRQQPRLGELLQPRRQAPARRLARRARPGRRPARRELDRPHHRQLGPLRAPAR